MARLHPGSPAQSPRLPLQTRALRPRPGAPGDAFSLAPRYFTTQACWVSATVSTLFLACGGPTPGALGGASGLTSRGSWSFHSRPIAVLAAALSLRREERQARCRE